MAGGWWSWPDRFLSGAAGNLLFPVEGGQFDGTGGFRACGQVAQAADLVGVGPVRCDAREHLLQCSGECLPLARGERANGVAERPFPAGEHPGGRLGALGGENHRDRTLVAPRPPFGVALRDKLVDNTDGGGLSAPERHPQLLDAQAGLLRQRRQRGAHGSRVTGGRRHGRGDGVGQPHGKRSEQVLQSLAHHLMMHHSYIYSDLILAPPPGLGSPWQRSWPGIWRCSWREFLAATPWTAALAPSRAGVLGGHSGTGEFL